VIDPHFRSGVPTRPRLIRPPRVLLASEQNHALWDVQGALGRHGYSVLRVFAGAAVLERARATCPDVILLDAQLPDSDCLDLSRRLRAEPLIGCGTPIVQLVPGRPSREDHVAALRAGVWALVRSPVNARDLIAKLDTYLLVRLETGRAPPRGLVDDVTGVYTRRGLTRRTAELFVQAAQHDASVACVALAPGLPGPTGLDALREIAQRLSAGGRRSDAVGRVGPSEFVVVAAGANRAAARRLAHRLRESAGAELRAGYEAVGSRRARSIDPRGLVARAARALELAQLEGKWVRDARE